MLFVTSGADGIRQRPASRPPRLWPRQQTYALLDEKKRPRRHRREQAGGNMEDVIEKAAMRKIYLRLLPFAFICYSLCYIDRINVSFAGLTMRGDLGL